MASCRPPQTARRGSLSRHGRRALALTNLSIFIYIDSVPFNRAVIEGRTSLGGSESACIGLATVLAALGHDLHIFATKLTLLPGDSGLINDVQWHSAEDELTEVLHWAEPDVFIALRMPHPFMIAVPAKLNLLWCQDMLADLGQIGRALTQLDYILYVSEYQRQQYLGVDHAVLSRMPSYVIKNGFDPSLIPVGVDRLPHRFIHISRPERGLGPLLQMWPAIRARIPEAELRVCRYDSMYDAQGWAKECARYDQALEAVHTDVGGITMIGQLTKPDLYRELQQASLMLYPGVKDFAETACIAAVEAQANGCYVIGSWKGALPETLAEGAGTLIAGDAHSLAYQTAFVDEVVERYEMAEQPGPPYLWQLAGHKHVNPAYHFDTIAREFSDWLQLTFQNRYQRNRVGVMRQLLHWDNHVPAKMVAREIIDRVETDYADLDDLVYDEVIDSDRLCDRVISQEEQTAEHYAEFSLDTEAEADFPGSRLEQMAEVIAAWQPRSLLDMAQGNGSLIAMCLDRLPDLQVAGWDYSPGVTAKAWAGVQRRGKTSQVQLHTGGVDDLTGTYDVVFCGEFLEHTERPWEIVDRLEQHCAPDGHLLITVPCGPLMEALDYRTPIHRGHTHSFSIRDITEMFRGKRSVSWQFMGTGQTPFGTQVGHWTVQWQPGGAPCGRPDYAHTILTTRPYQRLVASLIVRDAGEWIVKCLRSIIAVVDDVVVVDTGSTDETLALIQATFRRNVHVHRVPWPGDFSSARNESLRLAEQEYAADWVLWIDADEHLSGGMTLRQHLRGPGPFLGYILKQQHLMEDVESFSDVPCRIFRANHGIKFYGLVHEQPETAPDASIFPALDLGTAKLIHLGYETSAVRQQKMMQRNFPLLKREIQSPHPRILAWALFIRDLTSLAGYLGIADPDQMSAQARRTAIAYLRGAVARYHQQGFDDPAHKWHGPITPFYELALKWLGDGYDVAWGFAMATGTLKGSPKPSRFRVETPEQARRLIDFRLAEWMKQLDGPTFDTRPWTGARAAEREGAGRVVTFETPPTEIRPAGPTEATAFFAVPNTITTGSTATAVRSTIVSLVGERRG